jgi:hypothetical protein
MRRIGVRLPSQLWTSVQWYGRTAGLVGADGVVDISETVRDLITRGLVSDRGTEAGYRSGYCAGRSAAYADFMKRVGTPGSSTRGSRK